MAFPTLLIVLVCISFINQCLCGTRIVFGRCEDKGFTCEKPSVAPDKLDVTYTCNPQTGQDVLFYLWNFASPINIRSLTIKQCDTLEITFDCTGENKPIQLLKLANITNLILQWPPVSHNPPTMVFENISYIERIPRNTFSQIKTKTYRPGCFIPLNDSQSIVFNNVNIGTIETDAFNNLSDMVNFTWDNVTVMRLNAEAIKISMRKGGLVSIKNSSVEVMEHLAFQVVGEDMTILRSKFIEMHASSINGTFINFNFNSNLVNTVQAGAFSMLSQNVQLLDNTFEYLQAGAFQKIGPGLLEDSFRNFGKLRFMYKFQNNLIKNADAGALHPDYSSYSNVASDVTFMYNAMYCTCEGLAWLVSEVTLGTSFSTVQKFYKMVLDPQNNNICADTPCTLPLNALKRIIMRDGTCRPRITEKNLCKYFENTGSTADLASDYPLGDLGNAVPQPDYLARGYFKTTNIILFALGFVHAIIMC